MTEKYKSESQQRILSVLMILAGHELTGLEPSAIAKGLTAKPSAVTRDLTNLQIAGLAERLDNGNWRLTPKIVQISVAFGDTLNRARHKIDEIQQRYTRTPH